MNRRDWLKSAASALTGAGKVSAQESGRSSKTTLQPQDWYEGDLTEYFRTLHEIESRMGRGDVLEFTNLERAAMQGINAYESYKQGKPTQVTVKQYLHDSSYRRIPEGVDPYQGVLIDTASIDMSKNSSISMVGATFVRPTVIELSKDAGYGEIDLTGANAAGLTINSGFSGPGRYFRAPNANLEDMTYTGAIEVTREPMDFSGANLKNAKLGVGWGSGGSVADLPFNYERANLTGALVNIFPANLKGAVVMDIKDPTAYHIFKNGIGNGYINVKGAVILATEMNNDPDLKSRMIERGAIADIAGVTAGLKSALLRALTTKEAVNVAGSVRIAADELLKSEALAKKAGMTQTERAEMEAAVKNFDKQFPGATLMLAMSKSSGRGMEL